MLKHNLLLRVIDLADTQLALSEQSNLEERATWEIASRTAYEKYGFFSKPKTDFNHKKQEGLNGHTLVFIQAFVCRTIFKYVG